MIRWIKSFYNFIRYCFSKKVMIYIGGYPNIKNVGDVALYNAFEKLFPAFTLIHFTGGKLERTLYSLIKRKHPQVLAGGTLINHMCLRETSEAYQIWGSFYVFGTGVAQSSYWSKKQGYKPQLQEWVELLKDSPYIGVRGHLSYDELKSQGVNVDIFGDPVLSLAQLTPRENYRKRIGLNVGRSLGFVQGGEENLKQKFIDLANTLKAQGYIITWFVVCEDDMDITREIAQLTKTNRILNIYKDYRDYYSYCNEIDLFIGTKLHAVCLAMCTGVPSIMIEYRPKCRDFMLSIKQERFSIAADQFDLDKVNSCIQEVETNYKEISKSLCEEISLVKNRQKKITTSFIKKWNSL